MDKFFSSCERLKPENWSGTCLYERPDFRAASGSTLRPGGEALTLHGLALCGLLPAHKVSAPGVGNSVLDVGCGAGATAALLHARGFRVTGVDPSPDLLAEATARVPAVFLPGRADSLPVADASQDGVLCECVLSLTPDPDAALAEMARVLRPGGALLLSDIFVRDAGICYGPGDGRSCLAGARPIVAWRDLLTRRGFFIIKEEDHSRALAELAARLILGGGSLADLGSWLGSACLFPGGGRDLARHLGYILFAARKNEGEALPPYSDAGHDFQISLQETEGKGHESAFAGNVAVGTAGGLL